MEIADHAGETNGPEPVEETGARQGRGGLLAREEAKGREKGGEGLFRVDNHRQQ